VRHYLKSLANDESSEEETLYDQPKEDKKRLRVAGPFTVETLQNEEAVSPEALDAETQPGKVENFEGIIFAHLKSAGIKNGLKNEQAVFKRVERWPIRTCTPKASTIPPPANAKPISTLVHSLAP
jgi:adenine-specific DNA-methyltransferase